MFTVLKLTVYNFGKNELYLIYDAYYSSIKSDFKNWYSGIWKKISKFEFDWKWKSVFVNSYLYKLKHLKPSVLSLSSLTS